MSTATVIIRGQELDIQYKVESDPSVNYYSIEWDFPKTGVDKLILWMMQKQKPFTEDEEQDIYNQLSRYDPWDWEPLEP